MAENTCECPFPYKRLSPDEQEIRLLRLQPRLESDQPHCEISQVSLKDKPDFCALSYSWGDASDLKEIKIQGHTRSVTRNLEEALRYLQCVKSLPPIWIDAVCINQEDALEKGQQVALMADIYSHAQRTYLWVGPPVYFSNVAIGLIKDIRTLSWTSLGNPLIFAIRQLLERPYWTRVWIIQEAFYSKHAVIKCGHDEVDFDCIYELSEFMTFHNRRPRSDKCPVNPSQSLMKFSTKFPFRLLLNLCPKDRPKEMPIRVDLFRWLNYTDAFDSTLPRDRIFALLNLSFVTDNGYVRADYDTSKSNRRIFAEVTAYVVRSRSPTKYLLPLQLRQVGKKLDLPSWVPDWTIRAHDAPIVPKPYAAKLCPDHAPLRYDISQRPVQFKFSEDFETLTIRGLKIDKVSYAVSVADGDELARQPNFQRKKSIVLQRQVLDAYQKWEEAAFTSERNAYGSMDGLSEALWRTMMGNQVGDNEVVDAPTSDYGDRFEQWKSLVAEEKAVMDDPKLVDFDYRVTTLDELRAYCCTEKGRVGLVPPLTREGDLVFVFEDGRVPFILRATEEHWIWLGEAYIHGVMFGEALREANSEDVAVLNVR